ncbi:MAG: hypothetical protein HON90_04125 [Halobacteriovoraceae bacterium]|jgi:hypothetical protein|nr:hypothetical protein [Halobacteriovoraceae bacterium]
MKNVNLAVILVPLLSLSYISNSYGSPIDLESSLAKMGRIEASIKSSYKSINKSLTARSIRVLREQTSESSQTLTYEHTDDSYEGSAIRDGALSSIPGFLIGGFYGLGPFGALAAAFIGGGISLMNPNEHHVSTSINYESNSESWENLKSSSYYMINVIDPKVLTNLKTEVQSIEGIPQCSHNYFKFLSELIDNNKYLTPNEYQKLAKNIQNLKRGLQQLDMLIAKTPSVFMINNTPFSISSDKARLQILIDTHTKWARGLKLNINQVHLENLSFKKVHWKTVRLDQPLRARIDLEDKFMETFNANWGYTESTETQPRDSRIHRFRLIFAYDALMHDRIILEKIALFFSAHENNQLQDNNGHKVETQFTLGDRYTNATNWDDNKKIFIDVDGSKINQWGKLTRLDYLGSSAAQKVTREFHSEVALIANSNKSVISFRDQLNNITGVMLNAKAYCSTPVEFADKSGESKTDFLINL